MGLSAFSRTFSGVPALVCGKWTIPDQVLLRFLISPEQKKCESGEEAAAKVREVCCDADSCAWLRSALESLLVQLKKLFSNQFFLLVVLRADEALRSFASHLHFELN